MLNFIKKCLKLNKEELLFFPAASAVMFAFGHLILWLVMTFDKSEDLTSFEMGTVMALMGLLFVALFGSYGYMSSFNYALTMSQKRRNIITGLMMVSAIKATLMILIIYGLNFVERYVCNTFFSEYPMESNIAVIFKPHIMLLIICVFVALETIFGSLYTKFGTKYFWMIWMGIVFLMQLPARIIDSMKANDSHFMYKVIEFFMECNKNILFAILFAIVFVLIALPYVILKKQRVTI